MNIKPAEYAFQNDSILFPFPGASQEMCKIPIVILLSLQPNYWCGGHPAFWASRLFWFGSRQLRGNWFLAWIGILIIISWLSEEMCVLLRWMFEIMDISWRRMSENWMFPVQTDFQLCDAPGGGGAELEQASKRRLRTFLWPFVRLLQGWKTSATLPRGLCGLPRGLIAGCLKVPGNKLWDQSFQF